MDADPMNAPLGPHFINVDLEVWSRRDLATFGEAVQSKALVLYVGKSNRKHLVALEARATRLSSPEAIMWALLRLIRSLPLAARSDWKSADSRVFNIGFQAEAFVTVLKASPPGSGRWVARDPRKAARPSVTTLSPKLLQAVAHAKATITTTIYPPTKRPPAREKTHARRLGLKA